VIHVCNIQHGGGRKVRILAARHNVRGPLADFDVLGICQDGGRVTAYGRQTLRDFPRALGPEGLFEVILRGIVAGATGPTIGDDGKVVSLPRRTAKQWLRLANEHRNLAEYAEAEARSAGGSR
jgi:hypothetical protein